MASLLSWLGQKAKGGVQTVNRDVVHPVQAAVAQVNPLDSGRTYKTVMNQGAAYAPRPQASAVQQLTHNGATNLVGNSVVKPLLRSSLAINQGIANAELKLAGRKTLNAPQFQAQTGIHNLQKFSGYTGTKRQIAGDAITNISNIAAPGSSKLLEQGAAKVLPKVVPKIVPKVLASSATGAIVGAPSNVGAYLSSNALLTKRGVLNAAKTGAEFGAIGGAALPVVGAAARKAAPLAAKVGQKTAKAAVKANEKAFTPRANLEDQYTLKDFSNYLSGSYKPQPRELNPLLSKIREIGAKHGVDLVNGTDVQRIDRANAILDQIGKKNREISQGGYVGSGPANGAGANSAGGKVPKRTASTPSKVPSTSSASSVSPRTPRGKLSVQKLPRLPVAQSGKTAGLVSQSNALPNNTTLRQRGLTTSIKNSPEVSPALKKAVSSGYKPSNLAEKALNADALIKKDLNQATNSTIDALSKPTRQLTDQDAANAIATMKANDAAGNLEHSQQIHDLLAEHGTQHGQFINAFKLLSNRTPEGMLFGARRALKKAGIELDAQGNKELANHIQTIKSTAAGTPERDRAIHDLISFVHSHTPSSTGDKIVNFWRAGLLTSPITTGGNILGNTGEAVVRNIWTNPVATGVDALQSLVTGKRTKTLAGGQLKGAAQGVKDSATYLKTGYDKNNPLTKFDGKSEVNYGNSKAGKVVGGYVNGVYRGLGAQDKPFRQAATVQATIDLAKADAKNLKLKGRAKAGYIDQALSTPDWKPQTFQTANDSQAAGAFAVFANETALGKTASLLKQPFTVNGKRFGGAIRQFILPFSQVPASIAMRIIHRSDLGATEIVNQILRVRNGLPYDQRAVSEAIGNGTFGPAAIGAGYALSKSGAITGNYPTDPKEQAIWKAQGKQANSVKVGNRWYSLNYMQPFGTLLGIGDQIHQDEKAGKNPTEIIGNATGRAAKSIESQSFLQGINGLLSAVNDPQRSASQYINSTASSVVPNFVRTAARATDPLQRDTKNPVDALKGTIPGLREGLPASQDLFGRNLPTPDNALNQAFNPLRPSLVRNDPVVNELARLQEAGQGIIPTQFNKTSIPGQKLTTDQVRQLQTLVGTPTYQAYQQIMNDPRYAALGDEQKKAVLAGAGAKESDAFKRVFSTNNSIPITTAPSKATQTILNGGKIDYLAPKTPKTTKTATTTKAKTTKTAKLTVRKPRKVPTSYFKTASAIKAPSIPKVKVRKPVAFKAPSVKKLSVKKLPTNFKQRKTA